MLDWLQWQVTELRASLDRCEVAHVAMAAELMLSEGRPRR
jgi:hypothetical protein